MVRIDEYGEVISHNLSSVSYTWSLLQALNRTPEERTLNALMASVNDFIFVDSLEDFAATGNERANKF